MLSEEEREAIEYWKTHMEILHWNTQLASEHYIKVLLNLIEKQSKEIEELKAYKHDAELTKIACCTAQNCEALNNCIKLGRELQNADNKWEDKIKAKIEELNNKLKNADEIEAVFIIKQQQVLQSLLEKE